MRRAVARASLAAFVLSLSVAASSDLPDAWIVLEATPGTPGSDPTAAPPRFVLLKDGQVFVGGTAHLEAGRLEKGEAAALRKRAEQARKVAGPSPVALGGDPSRTLRLRVPGGEPAEVTATGDPAAAPPSLAPLATLLADLLRFDHPSLRPYAPTSYALTVREVRLRGGCRPWGFAMPIAEALAGPRVVTAVEASGWPTGAVPASVCAEDARPSANGGRYAVTLRPLLPGERP
ncbi:MAG TPA: hypothetical protein VMT70_09490 [Vicinamibacteria bacterium]|nr:hypothetical protein [Vicinamibacteria bacterium]